MIAIVVIGYNRADSLERLLNSLSNAEYSEQPQLIISLDKSECQENLIDIAKKCVWPEKYKKIIAHEQRLGLKAHVLSCGNLVEKYEAVVLLEDDLIVSKYFFSYVRKSIEKYGNDTLIAGISLYSHKVNVETHRPFNAYLQEASVFLLQFPQSWGQCWTKDMWKKFITWMEKIDDNIFSDEEIPSNVKRWGNQSWLKYQVAYCIKKKLYYVYPYISLTTNFTAKGEHNSSEVDSSFQVELQNYNCKYVMPDSKELVRYDAFFEREFDAFFCINERFSNKKICMNLYGYKTCFEGYDYMVSSAPYPYTIIDRIQLTFRPHEVNLELPINGSGIYIYDLKKRRNSCSRSIIDLANYDLKDYNLNYLLNYIINRYKELLKSVLKHKLKNGKKR